MANGCVKNSTNKPTISFTIQTKDTYKNTALKRLENRVSSPGLRPVPVKIATDLQVAPMRPRSRSHTTSRNGGKSPSPEPRRVNPAERISNSSSSKWFSEQHKSLLRHSWDHVGKRGHSGIGAMIFRRIFERCPSIRRMFSFGSCATANLQYNPSFQWHARNFVTVIDQAIRSLDAPFHGDTGTVLLDHGRYHARFAERGFEAAYWEVFAEAMTESATEWIGPGKHRETVRAWTILVSYIVDGMRTGYEDEVKKRKRASAPHYLQLNNEHLALTMKRSRSITPLLTTTNTGHSPSGHTSPC